MPNVCVVFFFMIDKSALQEASLAPVFFFLLFSHTVVTMRYVYWLTLSFRNKHSIIEILLPVMSCRVATQTKLKPVLPFMLKGKFQTLITAATCKL